MSSPIALMRHGATEWSAAGRYASSTDLSLSSVGRSQASSAASALAGIPVGLISSASRRASETAQIIGGAVGVERAPEFIELRELDFGPFEGSSPDENPELAEWIVTVPLVVPDGVEDPEEAAGRVLSVLSDQPDTDRPLVVVGHGWALRAAAAQLLGIGAPRLRQIALEPGHAIVVDRCTPPARLLASNLPPECLADALVGWNTAKIL